MLGFLSLLIHALAAPFRTRAQLEAEIILLRHQLNVLQRQASTRPRLTAADRLLFVWLCRLFPSLRNASTIRDADRILVLERGRIVERGTYDELMQLQCARFPGSGRAQSRPSRR